jgi:hypothetical protein
MNRPTAPDGCDPFHRQPQRYGIACLGSLDALPTNRFGFPFEQGFDQARSPILRALRPARVPFLERAASRFPGVLSRWIGHFAIRKTAFIIHPRRCYFHLLYGDYQPANRD